MKYTCYDTECFPNYWLLQLESGERFELYNDKSYGTSIDNLLAGKTLVSFNGDGYDRIMIEASRKGANNGMLKALNDDIIVEGRKYWPKDNLNHIDLMPVLPGMHGLKEYGAKNHTRVLQELPFDPDTTVSLEQISMIREYCTNDIRVLRELLDRFKLQLALREALTAKYGVDVRSRSDPQISEAIMRTLVASDKYKQPSRSSVRWEGEWLAGTYEVGSKGNSKDVMIAGKKYRIGLGGLHSCEKDVMITGSNLSLFDVASYYPSLYINLGIRPKRLADKSLGVYRGWYQDRLKAKKEGNKSGSDSLKTLLNGTFGKLNSEYSLFYDPEGFYNITLTGQSLLLTLISRLEGAGVEVRSANTDGILVSCDDAKLNERDRILKVWQDEFNLVLEETELKVVFGRSVNDYIAITEIETTIRKNTLANSKPGPSGWTSPNGDIIGDAIAKFLLTGSSISDTISTCRDIRKFITVKKSNNGVFADGEKVGKVVRYIHVKNGTTLRNGKGGLIPLASSVKLMPVLEWSDEVDFDYYIFITNKILNEVLK